MIYQKSTNRIAITEINRIQIFSGTTTIRQGEQIFFSAVANDAEGRISDYTQTVDYWTNYLMVTSYLYDTLDRVTDIRYPAAFGSTGSLRKLIQPIYYDVASRRAVLKCL